MYIELDIVYSYCVDKIFTSVLFSNSRTVWEKIRFITFLDYSYFFCKTRISSLH